MIPGSGGGSGGAWGGGVGVLFERGAWRGGGGRPRACSFVGGLCRGQTMFDTFTDDYEDELPRRPHFDGASE